MIKKVSLSLFVLFLFFKISSQQNITVFSPNKDLKFSLEVSKDGLKYDISFKQKKLIENSALGFDFDSGQFGQLLTVGKVSKATIDQTYPLIMGKVKYARDYCNEIVIPFEEKTQKKRKINLIVRAYNDGIAFRFEFPKQNDWNSYVMYEEKTQFRINGNPKTLLMYLPDYINSHEALYNSTLYNDIKRETLIEMPLTMEFPGSVFLSITEAAIRNYAGLYLVKDNDGLIGKLSPKIGQSKIKVIIDEFPHKTPWRVVSISDKIEDIIESNILTNLNEPCKIEDTSWIRPYKTTFTWWNGNVTPDSTFSPGNNFATNKYYIDFASRNNIDLHSIYGYAETPWYYDDNFNFAKAGPNADVTRPIPSLDLHRIGSYAKSVGVGLHLWVNWKPLHKKLEEAFSNFQEWGVKGLMIDFMDRNDQEMIQIQEEFLVMAAKYHLFIQFHGSSKPSGLIRTYPNELTREGALNYEVYKWATTVNANHDISIPFTRMLAGPTDYHLGGFRSLPKSEFKVQYTNPFVTSTRCHMLAMYVVLENYLTSICDSPKAYEGQPGFDFLRKVPTNWDEIKVVNAKINEYITIARKKNNDWWLGSITNDTEREFQVSLEFLENGKVYFAEIYSDLNESKENPNLLKIETVKVTSKDSIKLHLISEGGSVIHFSQVKD